MTSPPPRPGRADADPRLKATELLAFLSGLELAWIVSPGIPAADTAASWAAHQVAALQVQPAGPLVVEAVSLARREGFGNSCRPEHGRLLFALASGAEAIGETGTGCGVGLAWLASGARPGARLVSVEVDPGRAALAAELFKGLPQVTIIRGDWREIHREAPFDLLVLDGGGQGKQGGEPADPAVLLRPGGTLAIDDLTPAKEWPPTFQGRADAVRMHWLTHPALDAAELRLASDLAALVATRRWPANRL